MRDEAIASKLSPQNNLKERSGGSAHDALSTGEILAVIGACGASPLINAYYFAVNGLGWVYHKHIKTVSDIKDRQVVTYKKEKIDAAVIEFANLLKPWIISKYINCIDGTLPERTIKAVKAADDISMGMARYLAANPDDDNNISKYFKPIKPDTFRRKYKRFVQNARINLFHPLCELRNKIHEYTKKEK